MTDKRAILESFGLSDEEVKRVLVLDGLAGQPENEWTALAAAAECEDKSGFSYGAIRQRFIRYFGWWEVLTAAELARRLGMNRSTITRAIQSGRLPARRVGGNWLVNLGEALEALDEGRLRPRRTE